MPLIEGVGDEVVQFVGVILVLVIAALAWWSTNARFGRYRTIMVMRSRPHLPLTLRIRTSLNSSRRQRISTQTVATNTDDANSSDEGTRDAARVVPLQEMDSIVDADMAMINHHRLHFYRRIETAGGAQSASESTSDEGEVQDESEPASTAQIREMDSIVNAMEADGTTHPFNGSNNTRSNENIKSKQTTTVTETTTLPQEDNTIGNEVEVASQTEQSQSNESRILIKLKYLNDTLKEVEGSLDELLKDFKWRHFATELTAASRVRLIFNGRMLADDAATLRACGLHDNAVVHCLVHPSRPNAQNAIADETALNGTHELLNEGNQPERTWDLENILMTLVSVALTVVWFFRCEYSNMFTASASVALFGLTVFYSVAVFGLYLSDTFHFDRRPPQPVPNN